MSRRPAAVLAAVVLLIAPRPTLQAADYLEPALVFPGPGACTVTFVIPITGSIVTASRGIVIPLRLQDEFYGFTGEGFSQFTGVVTRAASAPAEVFDSLSVNLSADSTELVVSLSSTDSFLVDSAAHLIDVEVRAETRCALPSVYAYTESPTLSQPTPYLIDTSGTHHDLPSTRTYYTQYVDIIPPPPPDAVIGSYTGIEHLDGDTIVTVQYSMLNVCCQPIISLPVRMATTGVSARIVPESFEFGNSLVDPADVTIWFPPDSAGFWLHFEDGRCTEQVAIPLVSFDLEISGTGPGEIRFDTQQYAGARPLEYADHCPDYYTPGYASALIEIETSEAEPPGEVLPDEFQLLAAYPNPFNAQTQIRLQVARSANIRVEILSILGRRVETIWNGSAQPGVLELNWHASADLASGVYFVRATDGLNTSVKKVMLLK